MFKDLGFKISQISGLDQPTIKLEQLVAKRVVVHENSAVFLNLNVNSQQMPLKMMLREKSNNFTDLKVFWSYSNQYPCIGVNQNDGELKAAKVMTIKGHGELRFAKKVVYLGIYAFNKSVSLDICYAFGKDCQSQLNSCLHIDNDKPSKKEDMTNKKIYNPGLQLKYFQIRTRQSVSKTVNDYVKTLRETKRIRNAAILAG